MNKFQSWVKAARLRTLPLSLSGIIFGTALANSLGYYNNVIFILALLTTILFQITSNFANDYGDGVKGTDDDRIGPKRMLQSGLLSKNSLKSGILITALLGFLVSFLLLFAAFGFENLIYLLVFLVLSAISIWAAIRYTVGNNPYGYSGLGDLFVFLFFGLLAVLGTEFLFTKQLIALHILPAITIGLLSTAVLNLNNMRDHVQDKLHQKNTVVVKLGFEKAKMYHYFLLVGSFLSLLVYYILSTGTMRGSFFFIAFIPILLHLRKIFLVKRPQLIDPELKKIALSTFLLSILFYLAVNYFY